MIVILAAIMALLLYVIGGERGIVTFISLCFNIAVLSTSIILMSWGFDPIIVTFFGCLLISYITLFYQNGRNAKTLAAFWSVLIVLLFLFAAAYRTGYEAHLQGINEVMQREDEIMGLSPDININMTKIAVAMIITGLIGAATDTAMAVSSAIYEVFKNNRHLTQKDLFKSGLSIGRDILGTTINTLYFACIGESMMLFLLFKNYNYTILETINSKAFFQEFTDIIFSGISCVLVIPLTAAMTAYILKNPKKLKRLLDEDEMFNSPQ